MQGFAGSPRPLFEALHGGMEVGFRRTDDMGRAGKAGVGYTGQRWASVKVSSGNQCRAAAGQATPQSRKKEMTMPRKTKPICMTPDCGKPCHARGLCVACFRTAGRMVAKGETTWDRIVARGLGRPAAYRAPRTSKFRKAIQGVPVCGDCPVVDADTPIRKLRRAVGKRFGVRPACFG
jgi:hypothetical protein